MTPKSTQIAGDLRRQTQRGERRPGERLPSQVVLAGTLGVNEHTVASAIHRLIGEGYLRSEKGRGTWVGPRSSWPGDIVWTRENAPQCRCGDEPWFASFDPETGRWRPECVKHDAEALKEGRRRAELTQVPATAVWEDDSTGAKGRTR